MASDERMGLSENVIVLSRNGAPSGETIEQTFDRLCIEVQRLREENTRLRVRAERLEGLLRIPWRVDPEEFTDWGSKGGAPRRCAWCGGWEPGNASRDAETVGHEPDCEWQSAMGTAALSEGEGGGQ